MNEQNFMRSYWSDKVLNDLFLLIIQRSIMFFMFFMFDDFVDFFCIAINEFS
jgi:hypothetical protein